LFVTTIIIITTIIITTLIASSGAVGLERAKGDRRPIAATLRIGEVDGRRAFPARIRGNKMETILIIVLVVLLFGGGGWGYSRWRR
jgi:hypothetical protein